MSSDNKYKHLSIWNAVKINKNTNSVNCCVNTDKCNFEFSKSCYYNVF